MARALRTFYSEFGVYVKVTSFFLAQCSRSTQSFSVFDFFALCEVWLWLSSQVTGFLLILHMRFRDAGGLSSVGLFR